MVDSSKIWVSLQDDEISVGKLYEFCLDSSCGAVVLFSGIVRDFSEGRINVTALTYEAFESLAVKKLEEIAENVFELYQGVRRVAIVHRLGKLDLSESSVVVAVGSEHRDEAFLGAKYAIDSLKVKAPIWKKETWSGGEDWSSVATTIID
ncbi:molybdopterin synthase catalytic subunit [Ferrithrix thermotolerans DSM 19514]|uniref:Molybdopterin synthase catalytic subunit n=1 Tax=Ferrithrix thermotolerans DSM 19514 TaxID=1121881 RepID=A0A1M4SXS8_9ACTN|nr:molybdenum cofactor biosynthesis protein MoaE [Ferrithrix thermotolerans]SHE37000.1 molybdopterin synthase catalytic subunit [Ferrithrix thermotolerans DSM 19514]